MIKTTEEKQAGLSARFVVTLFGFIVVTTFAVMPAYFKTNAGRITNNFSTVTKNAPLDRSHGQKSVLFIRARFPDDPAGALPSDATLNSIANIASTDFATYSYNQFSLSWVVGPMITLPQPTSFYGSISGRTTTVLEDARLLAITQGFNPSDYDACIVYIPQFYGIFRTYLAAAGDTTWLEPADILGVPYGVEGFFDSFYFPMANRANGWQTSDGTIFGNCLGCGGPHPSGIADPFDVYGSEQIQSNYNIFHKTEVGWLPLANVPRIVNSGIYRLYAQDAETTVDAARLYGLRVPGYQNRDYWIEYRQNVGVLINWGGTMLLDMTPGTGAGFRDAPLTLGQTFSDPIGNTITFTAGGGANQQFVDLSITLVGSTPTPTPTPNPSPTPVPVIRLATLTGDSAGSALLINVAQQTAPISVGVTTPENFGTDKRTRIMLFAVGVVGYAADTDPSNDIIVGGVLVRNLSESVTVEARTADGRTYNLPVEFVGGQSLIDNLDTVTVMLISELAGAGRVELTLIVNGQRSNSPSIMIL